MAEPGEDLRLRIERLEKELQALRAKLHIGEAEGEAGRAKALFADTRLKIRQAEARAQRAQRESERLHERTRELENTVEQSRAEERHLKQDVARARRAALNGPEGGGESS